ncbi:hypothetical protein ACTGYI_10220, partial [Streptococcus suis]
MPLFIGDTPITSAHYGSTAVGLFLGDVNLLDGDGPPVIIPGSVATGINLSGLNYWTEEFPFNNL